MIRKARRGFTQFTVLLAMVAALVPGASAQAGDSLQQVLEGEHRSAAEKVRDRYRNPRETLTFFGVEPGMTVVEIFPGGGWYTAVLAPYLKGNGTLYAAGFDPESGSDFARRSAQRFKEKMASDEIYSEVRITVLAPPDKTEIAPAGSADRVLTFRNVHNWMAGGYAGDVFAAMYRALKPGGVLGVVEHRAAADQPQDPRARSGYVSEQHVIELAQRAGFEFVAAAEINANPRDTRDYPKGVWTLPPILREGDVDRERYLEIGESDRMTLKFIKPE